MNLPDIIVNMTMADFIGHIAYGLIFFGMILISKKSTFGWVLRMIGQLAWLVIGIYIGMSSVWIWGILFTFVDIKGWYDWRKQDKKDKEAKQSGEFTKK